MSKQSKRPDNPKTEGPPVILPTLYEHYTKDGIIKGLSTSETQFKLNDKEITLISGAIHYFRVPQEYWRDRLRKMRAAGLNTIETYVAWNLHEPQPGQFDFGQGESEFTKFLDIEKFVKTAQEEDLLVIVRPGPYICAEWEFGGLPSWLLRDKQMKIRTRDEVFLEKVAGYFNALFRILSPLQFVHGGPIIGFQIENEYGNVKKENEELDFVYLERLRELMKDGGLVELFFTSDTPSNGVCGGLPGVLATANFQTQPANELTLLQECQPGKPLMVMEYWTGWFDHWTEKHHTRTVKEFSDVLEGILKFPASVNMYMFHGGTNWGFMNGGNIQDESTDNGGYQPDTTSYDYDAPLNESGDYTEKFYSVQKLVEKYNKIKTKLPPLPPPPIRIAYEEIKITEELTVLELIGNCMGESIKKHHPLPMELLPINDNAGQSYGYVVYRKRNLGIPANSYLKIEGRVCDAAMVLVNGKLKSNILQSAADLGSFGYWKVKDASLYLGDKTTDDATLDIIVENLGRSNYGKLDQFLQHKGLWQGKITINDVEMVDWEIIPLEFKKKWTNNLKGWHLPQFDYGPALYKGILTISKGKYDTFLYMGAWSRGIVIVNGFVLSRYLKFGPQQTAYLPAPFLKEGANEIIVFEHFVPTTTINFTRDPIYQTTLA